MTIEKEEAKVIYSIMSKLKESAEIDFRFIYEERMHYNKEMYVAISLNNSYYFYITKKDYKLYNICYTSNIVNYDLDFNLVDIKYVLDAFIKNISVLEKIERYEGLKSACLTNLDMLKRPEYIRDLRLNEILC
jgi:hypothetical protein